MRKKSRKKVDSLRDVPSVSEIWNEGFKDNFGNLQKDMDNVFEDMNQVWADLDQTFDDLNSSFEGFFDTKSTALPSKQVTRASQKVRSAGKKPTPKTQEVKQKTDLHPKQAQDYRGESFHGYVADLEKQNKELKAKLAERETTQVQKRARMSMSAMVFAIVAFAVLIALPFLWLIL